ncbi:hypothetical protein ACQ4M3_07900 [Leptolyngbya sp. AN03gr2]|uniref:hypothetical protein n=1 Tax=unclassified Leptolyngbya TaxID=2650499 RepID=UPI003D31992A
MSNQQIDPMYFHGFWNQICAFLPPPELGRLSEQPKTVLERHSPEWFIAWHCLDRAFQQEFGTTVGTQIVDRFVVYQGSSDNHIFTLEALDHTALNRRGINSQQCFPAQIWKIPVELVDFICSVRCCIFDRLIQIDGMVYPNDTLTISDSSEFEQTFKVDRIAGGKIYLQRDAASADQVSAEQLALPINPLEWSARIHTAVGDLVMAQFPISPQNLL